MKDTILYQKIGLSPHLSDEELRREGKKLLLKHHPDKNENKEESSKKFIETKEILDILGDPNQRLLYHQIGVEILNKNSQTNSHNNSPNINPYDFFNEFKNFNDLFTNMTKMMSNLNKMHNYDNNFDIDINYTVKINLEIVDPYIPVILNIVYKRYNANIFAEEDKKVIITITAEKLIDIIENSKKIIMEGQGHILKHKNTNLIISIEEM